MRIELTAAEAELLGALLEAAHRDKLHELHHTATRAYAEMLRKRVDLIETMRNKIDEGRRATVPAGEAGGR